MFMRNMGLGAMILFTVYGVILTPLWFLSAGLWGFNAGIYHLSVKKRRKRLDSGK